MDQITLLILTVILNALVTGIVVYAIQKRIERANSQRIFEDQLKFKRFHEKQVETLENLYQKFILFYRTLDELIRDTKGFIEFKRKLQPDEFSYRYDPMIEKLHDYLHYYQSNRIFLSNKIADEVMDIYRKSGSIQAWVAWLFHDPDKVTSISKVWTDELQEFLKLEIADLERPAAFLDAMSLELDMEAQTLDKLYRSVVEMKV